MLNSWLSSRLRGLADIHLSAERWLGFPHLPFKGARTEWGSDQEKLIAQQFAPIAYNRII